MDDDDARLFVGGEYIGKFCPEGQDVLREEGSIKLVSLNGFANQIFFHVQKCEQCFEALKDVSRIPAKRDLLR